MAKLKKSTNFLSQIKLGESYTSLLLGAVVVVVVLVLVLSLFKGKNILTKETGSTSTVQNEQNSASGKNQNVPYTVKSGDDLWHIAENLYGSGYNWVDLASVNNLSNPNMLYVGTKLTVPDVKKGILTPEQNVQQEIGIKGNSYVTQEGDNLWDIAVRAYGDGYKWTEIAKANNLPNPDVIYVGNVLKLPR